MPEDAQGKACNSGKGPGCIGVMSVLFVGLIIYFAATNAISNLGGDLKSAVEKLAGATVADGAGKKATDNAQDTATASTPPQIPAPRHAAVANTGGDGVFIRSTPSLSDKIKAWPDGAQMVVIGEVVEADGRRWWNVQDPDGNNGWIPEEYLAVPTPAPIPTPTLDRSSYKLEIVELIETRGSSQVTIEGKVKNISPQAVKGIAAVAEWLSADNQFITSNSAPVYISPLLPGQTSPFKVTGRLYPTMSTYRLTMRDVLGGTVPTLESWRT